MHTPTPEQKAERAALMLIDVRKEIARLHVLLEAPESAATGSHVEAAAKIAEMQQLHDHLEATYQL